MKNKYVKLSDEEIVSQLYSACFHSEWKYCRLIHLNGQYGLCSMRICTKCIDTPSKYAIRWDSEMYGILNNKQLTICKRASIWFDLNKQSLNVPNWCKQMEIDSIFEWHILIRFFFVIHHLRFRIQKKYEMSNILVCSKEWETYYLSYGKKYTELFLNTQNTKRQSYVFYIRLTKKECPTFI